MATNKKRSDIKPEFIISPVPQLPEKKISEAQQIQLDIIAKTNFNFFNGRRIAEWLKENHRMWRAVLLPLDFISLRDMDDGHWHADTLYLYPEDGWQFKPRRLSPTRRAQPGHSTAILVSIHSSAFAFTASGFSPDG